MGESKDLIKTEEIGGEWVCRGEWKWFFWGKRNEMFFPDLISLLRPAVKILFYNYIRDDDSSDTETALKYMGKEGKSAKKLLRRRKSKVMAIFLVPPSEAFGTSDRPHFPPSPNKKKL